MLAVHKGNKKGVIYKLREDQENKDKFEYKLSTQKKYLKSDSLAMIFKDKELGLQYQVFPTPKDTTSAPKKKTWTRFTVKHGMYLQDGDIVTVHADQKEHLVPVQYVSGKSFCVNYATRSYTDYDAELFVQAYCDIIRDRLDSYEPNDEDSSQAGGAVAGDEHSVIEVVILQPFRSLERGNDLILSRYGDVITWAIDHNMIGMDGPTGDHGSSLVDMFVTLEDMVFDFDSETRVLTLTDPLDIDSTSAKQYTYDDALAMYNNAIIQLENEVTKLRTNFDKQSAKMKKNSERNRARQTFRNKLYNSTKRSPYVLKETLVRRRDDLVQLKQTGKSNARRIRKVRRDEPPTGLIELCEGIAKSIPESLCEFQVYLHCGPTNALLAQFSAFVKNCAETDKDFWTEHREQMYRIMRLLATQPSATTLLNEFLYEDLSQIAVLAHPPPPDDDDQGGGGLTSAGGDSGAQLSDAAVPPAAAPPLPAAAPPPGPDSELDAAGAPPGLTTTIQEFIRHFSRIRIQHLIDASTFKQLVMEVKEEQRAFVMENAGKNGNQCALCPILFPDSRPILNGSCHYVHETPSAMNPSPLCLDHYREFAPENVSGYTLSTGTA